MKLIAAIVLSPFVFLYCFLALLFPWPLCYLIKWPLDPRDLRLVGVLWWNKKTVNRINEFHHTGYYLGGSSFDSSYWSRHPKRSTKVKYIYQLYNFRRNFFMYLPNEKGEFMEKLI